MSFTLPIELNLGVAPAAPQGATKYAQRAALVLPWALGDLFDPWGASEPLVFSSFFLVPFGLDGPPIAPPQPSGLIPNPYSAATW